MTREEAIEILEDVVEWSDFEGYWPEEQEKALRFAIAALRGPAWVRTSERVPTEADAKNAYKEVLAVANDGGYWCHEPAHVAQYPIEYPYWMPLPPLPEEKP